METKKFEALMRQGEVYHDLRVTPGDWIIVRVDGRQFSKLTRNDGYLKPFDQTFSEQMVGVSHHLLDELSGIYAYTQSDEISVLLPQWTTLFGRSVEKLVSISAAIASARFTIQQGWDTHFDARVWAGETSDDVIDYFSWRQSDASRNALNGAAYWMLRQDDGLSARAATSELHGMSREAKLEMLKRCGRDFADMPLEYVRGIGVTRGGHTLYDLAHGAPYRRMIRDIINHAPET